jgi:flagellar FliL protein
MSKETKPAEEGAEAPKKSKKLLIIILAAVLVIVLAGGGAAFMLLKKAPHDDEEDVTEEKAKPKKKDKKAEAHSIFINLESFTVNLIPETGDQYLQVILSIELEDAQAEPALKSQMPKIRNNVMLLLSSQKASQLLPKEGKEHLAEALKEEINNIIEPPKKNKKGESIPSEGPVKAVLFTSFIIQ